MTRTDPIGDGLLIATVVLAFATAMFAVEALTGFVSRLFGRAR